MSSSLWLRSSPSSTFTLYTINTAFNYDNFGLSSTMALIVLAPILIYVASDLMQLYIYWQFISTLPVSLDESALLDGCFCFGLFTRIIFPLLAPATATVCIIKAINIMNDMYIPEACHISGEKEIKFSFIIRRAGIKEFS